MVRKTWFALAALAAIGVTFGAVSSAEAGHGRGGHHHHDDYHRHHDHHHHHHAAYRGGNGYGGYGFGTSGPSNVRSIYGPAYHSYYGTRHSGYGYGGRGYDRCYGPSYGRGGVSFSIGF